MSKPNTLSISKRKLILAIISIALICSIGSSSVVYVMAQGGGSTPITITSGPYPGAPSYTIYADGGTYYAKDSHGAIAFSSIDASNIINSALAIATGVVDITPGDYTISNSLIFPTNVALIGSKFGTYSSGSVNLILSGNINLISQVGTNVLHKDGATIKNLRLIGQGNSGDAIHLEYVSNFVIENIVASNFTGSALYLKEGWVGSVTNFKHDSCGSVAGSLGAVHIVSAEDATSGITFYKLTGANWNYKGLVIGTAANSNVNVNFVYGLNYEGREAYDYPAVDIQGIENGVIGGSIGYGMTNKSLVILAGDFNRLTSLAFYTTTPYTNITLTGTRNIVSSSSFSYVTVTSTSTSNQVTDPSGDYQTFETGTATIGAGGIQIPVTHLLGSASWDGAPKLSQIHIVVTGIGLNNTDMQVSSLQVYGITAFQFNIRAVDYMDLPHQINWIATYQP